MSNFGFEPVSPDSLKGPTKFGLVNGVGRFRQLYTEMEASKEKYGTARDMSVPEKEVSFLNGYFMFRKVRKVEEADVAERLMAGVAAPSPDQSRSIQVRRVPGQRLVIVPRKV